MDPLTPPVIQIAQVPADVYYKSIEDIHTQANRDFQIVHNHLVGMEVSNTNLWNTIQLQLNFLYSRVQQLEDEVARLKNK